MFIRKYTGEDSAAIEKLSFYCALEIKYHSDVRAENIRCAVDEDGSVIGVAYLKLEDDLTAKRKHYVSLSVYFDPMYEDDTGTCGLLLDSLLERLRAIKNTEPNKDFCLRALFEADDIKTMQLYLDKGFVMNHVVPVMKYDLRRETKHYAIPDDVQISTITFSQANICEYINDLSENGLPESEADIWFKTGNPDFRCFIAACNDEIVGSVSVWNIGCDRAATENVFVKPSFRRKNIARELLATAFDALKKRGMKIGTLTVVGTDIPAIKLYLSCGYELYYTMIEMQCDI